ncbi:hypothetical protein ACFLZH_05375 [Patescibacteria group bacterium]
MKRILSALIITLLLFLSSANLVFAQEAGTLLPETEKTDVDCIQLFKPLDIGVYKIEGQTEEVTAREWFASLSGAERNDFLACAIKFGKIKFWMIPFYIVYFIEFVIGISGLVAVLFLVVGGFQLIMSGASEGQEKAKNTIKYALMGMVVVLVAWVLVNLVQFAITI